MKRKMEWKNIYRGFLMGITDLIPGVSGGTMAIILGVYDRLLEALSGFFSKKWRQQLSFLVPLAIGIVSALLLFSRLIAYLLQNYFEPTQFFFLGLIIGIIPFIIKGADVKRNFAFRHWFVLIAAAILLALTGFMNPNKAVEPITSLNTLSILGLFLAGWLASMAMLLPGISGSFVLLLLGVYSTGIYALSTFNIPLIVTIVATPRLMVK
jgi:putative membrane protein